MKAVYLNYLSIDLKLFITALLFFTIFSTSFAAAATDDVALSTWDGKSRTQSPADQEPKPSDVAELKPGVPIERELAGGETHFYHIRLTAGQYAAVLVQQKSLDVSIRVLAPDGSKMSEVDNDPIQGTEEVFLIAPASGEYRLGIKAVDDAVKPGAYIVKLGVPRESTARDRIQIAAAKVYEEGSRLRDQGAADARRKAITKFEESLPLWREAADRRGEAYALTEMGIIFSNLGEPKKALEHDEAALVIWRALGDRFNEATALTNIGVVYWRAGDSTKALEYHSQALAVAQETNYSGRQAIIFSNMGAAYNALGRLHEALKYMNQALPLFPDRRRRAVTLNNIATTYQQLGEFQKALEYHHQALPLRRAVGDRQGEANTLHNLGELYSRTGEPQKAIEYFNQSLALKRLVGARPAEAITLQTLSRVNQRLGNLPAALDFSHQALALSQAVGDRRLQAYELQDIGSIHLQMGDLAKALEHLDQALKMARAVSDQWAESYILANLGEALSRSGDVNKALEYFDLSLKLSRRIQDQSGEAAILFGMARAYRRVRDLSQARRQIELALKTLEASRTKLISQQWRASFMASVRDPYEFYVELLMQMHWEQPSAGLDVAAFQASERARARGLVELLTEAAIDVRQGIDPNVKRREQEVYARISSIQIQLIQANSRSNPDQKRIAALNEEATKIETEREQIETEIRQKHPRYATLQYPTALSLNTIQQALDEKTVVLEFYIGKETSFLFAISKDEFLTARLPAANLITDQVNGLREAIATRPNRSALSNYLHNGQSLYRELVEPAQRMLSGKQALIIIPDGILHYLPFEVLLQSAKGRNGEADLRGLPYLVRNFAVSYAPSATILSNLASHRPTTSSRKTLLAFGDPDYGSTEAEQTVRVRTAVRSAFGEGKPWQLPQLPETRREVNRIAKLYPPSQVEVYLGSQATEANAKSANRLGQYRFLHLAVHGLLNENRSQYSGVVLSLPREQIQTSHIDKPPASVAAAGEAPATKDEDGTLPEEDGLLQVFEIFNLKLNADLVVLSACETGLGKETKGEGLVGLTQAFLYAGSPALVVSVWKVQDRSTAELMVAFYRHLKNPTLNKAQALRQAQLDMIRQGTFSHPYYWAGFVLIGRP